MQVPHARCVGRANHSPEATGVPELDRVGTVSLSHQVPPPESTVFGPAPADAGIDDDNFLVLRDERYLTSRDGVIGW
jgi:hypothetical protein